MKRLLFSVLLFPHTLAAYLIPLDYTKDFILSYTMNIRFNFEEKAFGKIDDMAMDSPLGPTLSDVL